VYLVREAPAEGTCAEGKGHGHREGGEKGEGKSCKFLALSASTIQKRSEKKNMSRKAGRGVTKDLRKGKKTNQEDRPRIWPRKKSKQGHLIEKGKSNAQEKRSEGHTQRNVGLRSGC